MIPQTKNMIKKWKNNRDNKKKNNRMKVIVNTDILKITKPKIILLMIKTIILVKQKFNWK